MADGVFLKGQDGKLAKCLSTTLSNIESKKMKKKETRYFNGPRRWKTMELVTLVTEKRTLVPSV